MSLKDSYVNGECPDCGQDIPDNVQEGNICSNCEHVFLPGTDKDARTISSVEFCLSCKAHRIVYVRGKCSDLFSLSIGDYKHNGYVVEDIGIGGGDYIDFGYCLNCGKILGDFPKNLPSEE